MAAAMVQTRPISGGEVEKKMPARRGVKRARKKAWVMNVAVPRMRRRRFFLPKEAKGRRRISTLLMVSRAG
jgi:hypothetical protein